MQVSSVDSPNVSVISEAHAASPVSLSEIASSFEQLIAAQLATAAAQETAPRQPSKGMPAMGTTQQGGAGSSTTLCGELGSAEKTSALANPLKTIGDAERTQIAIRDTKDSSLTALSTSHGLGPSVASPQKKKAATEIDSPAAMIVAAATLPDNASPPATPVPVCPGAVMPAISESRTHVAVAVAKAPTAAQHDSFEVSRKGPIDADENSAQLESGPSPVEGRQLPIAIENGAAGGVRNFEEPPLARNGSAAEAAGSPSEPTLATGNSQPTYAPVSIAGDPPSEAISGSLALSSARSADVAPAVAAHSPVASKAQGSKPSSNSQALDDSVTEQKVEGSTSPSGADLRVLPVTANAATTGSDFPSRGAHSVVSVNPFTQLDSGPDLPGLQTHVSSHAVSVGYRDDSYGWMEIRTQTDGGRMSAVLQTSSTEAHRALSAEAPAMSQYLTDRDIPIHTLSVDHGSPQGGATNTSPNGQSDHASQSQGDLIGTASRSFTAKGFITVSPGMDADEMGASHISVRV